MLLRKKKGWKKGIWLLTREGNTQESCSNPEYIIVYHHCYQITRACCIIFRSRDFTRFKVIWTLLQSICRASIYIYHGPRIEQITSRHGTGHSHLTFPLSCRWWCKCNSVDCAYACVSNYPSTCFQQRLLYLRRWVWYLDRSPSQMQLDMPFR